MIRAGFELTGEGPRACELMHSACERLLPARYSPQFILQSLNDTSIGYVTVLQVFDEYLQRTRDAQGSA